jgi:pSer/pThr/pTyr-binding forkhead associated (FHA) protein
MRWFMSTQNFEQTGIVLSNGLQSKKGSNTKPLPTKLPIGVRVMLMDSHSVYNFPLSEPIIIGRSAVQNIVTLDLTPHNAQELGISRNHAKIEVYGDRIMLTDLGSANGTHLNQLKLVAHHYHQIQHGDEIKLGNAKIRVYFVYAE